MSGQAIEDGAAAFERGLARTANPHAASTEDWSRWQNGWEKARSAVQYVAATAAEECFASHPSKVKTSDDPI